MSKFYNCSECGLIELPDGADVEIICHGDKLEEITANTTDGALEKHVPQVVVDGNEVEVRVGEVSHPMLDEHWITQVVLDTDKGSYKKSLKPGEEPVVTFVLDEDETPITAYEYCNLHGLWKKDI